MAKNNGNHEEETISSVEQYLVEERVKSKISEKQLDEAAGVISDRPKGQGSVLAHLTQVHEEVRQMLAGANFEQIEDAYQTVACLAELRMFGCDLTPILDLIAAECGVASVHRSKTEWGVQALTHLDFGRSSEPSKKKWYQMGQPSSGGGDQKPV